MKFPHRCFTAQLFNEPCPNCANSGAVFVGHGTARHCMNCTITWGEDESSINQIELSVLEEKIEELPEAVQQRINETVSALSAAMNTESRLQRLMNISDADWQTAIDTSESDNDS